MNPSDLQDDENQIQRNEIQGVNIEKKLSKLKKIQITINNAFHLNVAKILSFESNNQDSINVQYESNGNSMDVFLQKRRSPLQENQIVHIFSQVLQGYNHLKNLNIIHNNISQQNIFIKQIQMKNNFIVKISNYIQASKTDFPNLLKSQIAENKNQISQHNQKDQIYQLGIILQQLCYGTQYQNKSELTNQSISQFENKQLQSQEKQFSEKLQQLIEKMLIDDDSKRISWNELIIHQDLQPKYLILQKRFIIDLNAMRNEEYFVTFDIQNENLNLLTKHFDTNINQNYIELLRQIKSKGSFENIIKHIEIIEEYPSTYLIMENWEYNLYEYGNTRQFQLTLEEILVIVQQILKAYLEVQALNLVEVKLNTQNIVVNWNENNEIAFKILLTEKLQQFTFDEKSPIEMFHYVAPEIILTSTQNSQSNIFSLGAILHYITYGKSIYPQELQYGYELKEQLINLRQVGFVCSKPFKYFNDLYLQLIDEMLIYSAESRIDWESIKKKIIIIYEKSHIIYGEIKKKQMNQEDKENFKRISMILKKPLKNIEKLEYCDKLLDLDPFNQSLYYKKGQILYGSSDRLQAIESFNQVIKINPKNQYAYSMKSYLLSQLGRSEDQIKCYQDIIRINPKIDNYRNLALTLSDMSKVDELIECCDQAIQLDPKDYGGYEMKAHFLMKHNFFNEAIQVFEQKYLLLPHSSDLINIAECLDRLGRYDEANKKYDDAIQLRPDYAYHYESKAKFLCKLGKLDEALDILDQGIQTNPNNIDIYSIKVEFLKELGKLDHANDCLEKGIQQNPGDVKFILKKAKFLHHNSKYKEAIEYYDQAILLKPQDYINYYDKCIDDKIQIQIAFCLRYLDLYDEAITCLDWAIQFNPHNDTLFRGKGELLKDLCRYDESIRCFNTTIQIDPKDSYNYVLKGQCLEDQGNYKEALKAFDSALQLDPNEYCYINYKGQCLMSLQQYSEAIKCFNEAISIYNGDSRLFYQNGKCLQYLGKYDEAIDNYNKAIQLNPEQHYIFTKNTCLEEQMKDLKAKS